MQPTFQTFSASTQTPTSTRLHKFLRNYFHYHRILAMSVPKAPLVILKSRFPFLYPSYCNQLLATISPDELFLCSSYQLTYSKAKWTLLVFGSFRFLSNTYTLIVSLLKSLTTVVLSLYITRLAIFTDFPSLYLKICYQTKQKSIYFQISR